MGPTPRTDLRKLSDHLKLYCQRRAMRAVNGLKHADYKLASLTPAALRRDSRRLADLHRADFVPARLTRDHFRPSRLAAYPVGDVRLGDIKFRRTSRRGKALACAGAGLALAGLCTTTAAAATSADPAPVAIAGAARDLSTGEVGGLAGGPLATFGQAGPAGRANPAGGTPGAPELAAGAGHRAHTSLHVARHGARSWKQVRDALARDTYPRPKPGKLPLADRLVVGPTSGHQEYLPVTAARRANAAAIVRQALHRHMGLRAAVIAVATAMQESGLSNLGYGDRDSLGLFQQRPSMGWGTARQITRPSYAAGAFLRALAAHQHRDPGWAARPLWQTAQAVQRSGFPYAYAKWEAQAAQLVQHIARHMA